MRREVRDRRLPGILRGVLDERYDLRGYRRLPRCVTVVTLLLALPFAVALWRDAVHLADVSRAVADTAQQHARRAAVRDREVAGITPLASPDAALLLARLEHAWRDDIGLRMIDVDIATRRARLQLSTVSVDSLLAFVERLERTQARVALERHARADDRTADWPLDASLEATW